MEMQAVMQPRLDPGGVLLAVAPFNPLACCPPSCSRSDSLQATGAADTELEHQDCVQVSWDQRSRGKETCNKYRAFIQALG